jgi:serine/threonine-protein kinase
VQTVVVTSTVAQTVVSTPPPVTVAPTFAPTPGGGSGDLGVSAPIANLGCTGQYAAFVGSAVDPGSYQAEVQHLLSSFPGSSYLMTESSCAALVPTVNGNSVYAVYLGPFSNPSQACAAANRAGGGTYVKALSNTSPDAATVEC